MVCIDTRTSVVKVQLVFGYAPNIGVWLLLSESSQHIRERALLLEKAMFKKPDVPSQMFPFKELACYSCEIFKMLGVPEEKEEEKEEASVPSFYSQAEVCVQWQYARSSPNCLSLDMREGDTKNEYLARSRP